MHIIMLIQDNKTMRNVINNKFTHTLIKTSYVKIILKLKKNNFIQ